VTEIPKKNFEKPMFFTKSQGFVGKYDEKRLSYQAQLLGGG